MSQENVKILKFSKESEYADWMLNFRLNTEENMTIPLTENGPIAIGSLLKELMETIETIPQKYPFEYNMMSVKETNYRELYLDFVGEVPVSIDVDLKTAGYIRRNIKQTNWVPNQESVRKTTQFAVGKNLHALNENAISTIDDYKVIEDESDVNRFWLLFNKKDIKAISPNMFEGYISGYAWPYGIKIPETINNQNLLANENKVKVSYSGLEPVIEDTSYNSVEGPIGVTEKYQLPKEVLYEINEESIRFNDLLIRDSSVIAVSLQYDKETKRFGSDKNTESLQGIVYGTNYNSVEDTMSALEGGSFDGYNINKEMLKPLYSKYQTLMEEYPEAEPMPLVLFNGITEEKPRDAIKTLAWVKDLQLGNNPVQFTTFSRTSTDNTTTSEKPKAGSSNSAPSSGGESAGGPRSSGGRPSPRQPAGEEGDKNATGESGTTPEDANQASGTGIVRHDYVNNDQRFVLPYDDRLAKGEIYSKSSGRRATLPWDYSHRVRIGDVFIPIPPTSISMDKQYTNKKLQTMRAKSSLQTGVANTRNIITLEVYYADLEDVNGTEVNGYDANGTSVTYYMDGLRPLIAQFKKAPFLPIDNEYINVSLGVDNVVLRNIQVATVPGFPEALRATIILEEFDLQPYVIGEKQLGSLINYPLLRYHYQRSLHKIDKDEPWKTYIPPIEELSNDFSFYLLDENELAQRDETLRTLREIKKPIEYEQSRKDELEREPVFDDEGNEIKPNPDDPHYVENINKIESDFVRIQHARKKLKIFMNELSEKKEAKEYGLEDAYQKAIEVPVIPGGYTSSRLKLTEEQIKYGHRLAVMLYGEDSKHKDAKYETSNIPFPKNDIREISSENLDETYYLSDFFMPYQMTVSELEDSKSEVRLPGYSSFKNKARKITDKVINDSLPGYYIFTLQSDTFYYSIIRNEEIPHFKYKLNHINVLILPAGDAKVESALDEVLSDFKRIRDEINDYTDEYNKLKEKITTSESTISMIKHEVPNIIPTSLTVSLENNFSTAQVQAAETPTMQFFGAVDPEISLTFQTDDAGVQSIETMFRQLGMYVKEYREGIVSGFMKIENPLVNMFGIENIIPTSVQYDSIENHPNRKIVTITASGFDKTQRRQESIYGFSGGDPSHTMIDRAYDKYDASIDRQYVDRYMRQMELYPDLEMPKVSELNAALPYIDTGTNLGSWENRTDQVYLDPDFYVSTNTTLRKIINSTMTGDEDHELRLSDTVDYVMDTKYSSGTATNFVTVGKSGDNYEAEGEETDYADPILNWENYGNEHKFQPVVIGVTHGSLTGTPGGSNALNGGSSGENASQYGAAPADIPDTMIDLPIKKMAITGSPFTSGTNNKQIGITLHQTGNPNAGANAIMHHNLQANLWKTNPAANKSWHYQVDDKEAIQSFEHNVSCWHASDGTGDGNMHTIAIEACINSDGNYPQTIFNTAKLMAGLCYVYGFNPKDDIHTHQDWGGKYCPEQILNGKDGWTLDKVIELTEKELDKIKAENTQGVPITTEQYVNSSHVIPDYTIWKSWSGNEVKNKSNYENWVKDTQTNKIDQEKLWFKISDLVIKHFGAETMLFSEFEQESIMNRKVPYRDLGSYLNAEQEYLSTEILGLLSYVNSTEYYNYMTEDLYVGDIQTKLKNGRPQQPSQIDHIGGLATGLVDPKEKPKTPFQRIVSYIKALIRVESKGNITVNKLPYVKDKNADGSFTKGGFAGAKFTEGVSVDMARRLLWDWEYNLEEVIKDIAKVYKTALNHPNREINVQALDWAIASRSWIPLPDYLTTAKESDDNPVAYDGGRINVMRNPFFNDVEEERQRNVAANWANESVGMLYQDLNYKIIKNIHLIYTGLEDRRTLAESLNTPNSKYLQGYQPNIYETRRPKSEDFSFGGPDGLEEGDAPEEEETGGRGGVVTDEELEEHDEAVDDSLGEISKHYSPWDTKQSVDGMYIDSLVYDHTGRLLKAFPSYLIQLIDEGKWYGQFKTWDNFYGYNAIHSIDVYKSRKIVADTATIAMSNMYSGLSSESEEMGYDALDKPSFFSSQFWKEYIMGDPKEEVFMQRRNLDEVMKLKPGARLHVRMGYGADPFSLPIVFNGVVTEVDTGEIVNIVAQGDGLELTNKIGGDENEVNKSFFKGVEAPRDVIGKLMTSKGNWLKDMINTGTGAYFFKDLPSGIAHFGSDIHTEEGNLNMYNDDYGESMINVYTNDGLGSRSAYHDENGHRISNIDSLMVGVDDGIDSFFGAGGSFDEEEILVSLYGTSLWDIVTTFALCTHDYHASVFPFEYRSSLFFGKTHWPVYYGYNSTFSYDEGTGEWVRNLSSGGELMKTFMQAHFAVSKHNIISNNIKASAEGVYNSVVVAYDGHTTPVIQADSDIRYDQQRTAYVEGTILVRHDRKLGSSIRNFFTAEVQANIYGHSTVRDFMKDMYKGSYTMIGEGSIKPHDLMYISDTIQDVEGIHLVKAVQHSMSLDTGFVSIVEPDAYVVNFDLQALYIGQIAWSIGRKVTNRLAVSSHRGPSAQIRNGIHSNDLSTAVIDNLMTITSNPSQYPHVGSLSNNYLAGIMRKSSGLFLKNMGNALQDAEITYLANRIMDTTVNISREDTQALVDRLNDIKQNGFSSSINKMIEDQKLSNEAIKKFKYNQKNFFLGLNAEAGFNEVLSSALQSANNLNNFWNQYETGRELQVKKLQEEGFFNGLEQDLSIDELLNLAEESRPSYNLDFEGQPNRDGVQGAMDNVANVIKGAGKLIKNIYEAPRDIVMTPVRLTHAALSQAWTTKKQNSEAVKAIPLTYKGKEWVAAMEGHRGGVWGDTPSAIDRWYNMEFGDDEDSPVAGLLPRILNSVTNKGAGAYEYHVNPTSEVGDRGGTLPPEEDTGGYFIDGTAVGSGNNMMMASKPRIVGGAITQEAIEDAKNQTITVIGDSLGVGTEPKLGGFSWKSAHQNNYGSRQWSHNEKVYDGLAQLKDMSSANKVNEHVVMILGTNRGVEADEIAQAIDIIGPSRKLVLVDTASQVSHNTQVATAYKAASEQYTNAFYANWSSYAKEEWYGSDNIHMTSDGYKNHAEFITQAIYEVANTDWSAAMAGSVPQPTAKLYDSSKQNLTKISITNWNLQEVNSFRMNAADPPFVTGDWLNQYMLFNRKGAKLNGHGETVKLMADWYGIATGAALGIWIKESQWGLTSCGGDLNFGCVMWDETRPFPKKWAVDRYWIDPATVESSVAFWFKYVRYRYLERGAITYKDFLDIYSPGFENDQSTFKNLMWGVLKSMGYDFGDRVSKTNYGSESDDVISMNFLSKIEASNGAGATGSRQPSGSMFKAYPTTPSKSQINYGFAAPGYESHKGIDIVYMDGSSDIFAIEDGTVTATNSSCSVGNRSCGGGWGNFVRIKHPNGYQTLYAHLERLNVKQGQGVRAGQVIGKMGNTGRSDGKHLHLELWEPNDTRINPERYIKFTGYKRLF